jgi:PAS domain S-box-containing protein
VEIEIMTVDRGKTNDRSGEPVQGEVHPETPASRLNEQEITPAQEGSVLFNAELLEFFPVAAGLAKIDKVGTIEVINKRLQDLFGYTRQELISVEHWANLVLLNPLARQNMALSWQEDTAAPEGAVVGPVTVEATCKDGSIKTVEFWSRRCRGLWVATFLDRSEEKKLAQALALSERSLRQSRDAAEAANRAKSVFLTTMSLEIRTLLNSLLDMLHLLETTELDARQLGYLSKTTTASEALLGRVQDILDFSKIE